MTTPTKSADTRSQLRNLMSQHTAATFSRPNSASPASSTPANSLPAAPARDPLPAASPARATSQPQSSRVTGERYTVRLTPQEIQKLDSLTLEVHQRLGKRITLSDVLRIGLLRVSPTAPITADELTQLRATDRRRIRPSHPSHQV